MKKAFSYFLVLGLRIWWRYFHFQSAMAITQTRKRKSLPLSLGAYSGAYSVWTKSSVRRRIIHTFIKDYNYILSCKRTWLAWNRLDCGFRSFYVQCYTIFGLPKLAFTYSIFDQYQVISITLQRFSFPSNNNSLPLSRSCLVWGSVLHIEKGNAT